MDKKDKLGFIRRQFQRFMKKKKEIVNPPSRPIKQFSYNSSHGLRKLLAGAVLVSSFGMGAQAKPANANVDKDIDATRKIELAQNYAFINTNIIDSTNVANLVDLSEIEIMKDVKTQGTYNGHNINFKTVRPENIVHIFEAGGNQTTIDAKNIQNASYIGEFQFNLNNTIYDLAKYCRKDFPELAKAAGVDVKTGRIISKNARSQHFYNTWCQLCKGKNSEKFARMRLEFMFKTHFQPTFDKLHDVHPDFPHITISNYAQPENFLFSTMVMGTATQSPGSAFKIINKQINIAKETAKKNGINTVKPLDVYTRVANRKIQLWGFASRYNAEKKIATDLSAYFEANAKLYVMQNQEIFSPEVIAASIKDIVTLNAESLTAHNITDSALVQNMAFTQIPQNEVPIVVNANNSATIAKDNTSTTLGDKKIKIKRLLKQKKVQVRQKVNQKKKTKSVPVKKRSISVIIPPKGMENS